MTICMAGAGLSCATIARELAEMGHAIEIFEQRRHIAGNCYTERDPRSQVMLHLYGPHIFHTNDDEVWSYVNRFAEFRPYINRVKAVSQGRVYPLPINLLTINQYFGKTLTPVEARAFIENQSDRSIEQPHNFEEQALKFVGPSLYEAFFKNYTQKQWGVAPTEIPPGIFSRLPVRFDYDDNYFSHRHQGIPAEGYTPMVARILDHPNITVHLNTSLSREMSAHYAHTFYSGSVDGFYGYDLGRLPYRTLEFERFEVQGDFQGCAVMNYCDLSVPYTRITEHKHFAPWETHDRSVCYREFSRDCKPGDTPYYPVHLLNENGMLNQYLERARHEERTTFVGRLGTFRYLDMDQTIRDALDVARSFGLRRSEIRTRRTA
jgi:UDP-galactopyranose mutase